MGKKKKKGRVLDTLSIARAIKAHPDVGGEVTIPQIKCVLNAYGDIVKRAVLNNFRVLLPNLGTFEKAFKKGWKGRELTYVEDGIIGTEDAVYKRKYIEAKPSYYTLGFTPKPSVKNEFKVLTSGKVMYDDEDGEDDVDGAEE